MKPEASLSNTVSSNCSFPTEKQDSDLVRVVGVFSHHRDVQVALEELVGAGYPSNWITLIARHWRQYNIDNCFNQKAFDLNQNSQGFFQRLFQRSKYFLLVTGKQNDVDFAARVIGHRRGYSEVWRF